MQFVDGVRPRTPLTPVLNLAPDPTPMPDFLQQQAANTPTVQYVATMDGIKRRVMPEPQQATPMAATMALPNSEFIPTERRSLVLPWRQIGLASLAVTIAASTAFGLYQYRLAQATTPAAETTHRTAEQVQPAAQTTTPAVDPGPSAEQQASAAAALQASQLQTILNQFSVGAPAGIVIKDLKTGAAAGINQTQVFTSASLYKLFVAHGIYKDIDSGKRSLSDRINGRSLGECLNLMITISDNGCGEALETSLGYTSYNAALKSYGFAQTKFGEPMQTSAGDVATLLERLYNGTLLSPSSTNQFMSLLKAQKINNRLPQGLPAGTTIAHKTGDLDGLMHDAGIVFGPKTDYLVVMTSGPWNYATNSFAAFANLAQLSWSNLEQ